MTTSILLSLIALGVTVFAVSVTVWYARYVRREASVELKLSSENAAFRLRLVAFDEKLKSALARQEALSGIDLAGHDLSGLDLHGKQIADANLSRSVLRGVRLTRSDLTNCNLDLADLTGADLEAATLVRATLRQALLTGANLREALLRDADLSRATLVGSDARRADISGADFRGADLTKAMLDGVVAEELSPPLWDDETVWPDNFNPRSVPRPRSPRDAAEPSGLLPPTEPRAVTDEPDNV